MSCKNPNYSKDHEARADQEDHHSPSDGYFSTPSSSARSSNIPMSGPARHDEANAGVAPLGHDSDAPPPPYTPSVTSPLAATGSQGGIHSYSTFGTRVSQPPQELDGGRPQPPQEMGGMSLPPPNGFTRDTHKRKRPTWCNLKNLVLSLVVLAVCIAILTPSFRAVRRNINGGGRLGAPQKLEDGVPFTPSFCKDARYHITQNDMALSFDGTSGVGFVQSSHGHSDKRHLRVGGHVNVRRLTGSSPASAPGFALQVATSEKDLDITVDFNKNTQRLEVSVPRSIDWPSSDPPPCVEIQVDTWVPADGVVKDLTIDVIQLDVELWDDLSIHTKGSSSIKTTSGDIISQCPYNSASKAAKEHCVLDSETILASSTSGDITGSWPIYKDLHLKTTSGDIKIDIKPQDDGESDPEPASLALETVSGVIYAKEPIDDMDTFPHYDYSIKLRSSSGDIRSRLAFGSKALVETTSGDVDLDLVPLLDIKTFSPREPAFLDTRTTSGKSKYHIFEPVWYRSGLAIDLKYDGPSLDSLKSTHKSVSGDVELLYPRAWEGNIKGHTITGKLELTGKDVRIISASGGWLGKKIEAVKGYASKASSLEFDSTSGDLRTRIGEL